MAKKKIYIVSAIFGALIYFMLFFTLGAVTAINVFLAVFGSPISYDMAIFLIGPFDAEFSIIFRLTKRK